MFQTINITFAPKIKNEQEFMESKEYFEKVMQDYNQHRNGRSLRKYCNDEASDYKWVMEYKKSYPMKTETTVSVPSFTPLTVTENDKAIKEWSVSQLVLTTPAGESLEIKCDSLFAVTELLNRMS